MNLRGDPAVRAFMSARFRVGERPAATRVSADGMGGSVEDAPKDADSPVHQDVTSGEPSTKSVTIPAGTARWTVEARYDEIGGVKEADDDREHQASNPKAGAGTNLIDVGGVAENAFGSHF